MIILPIYVHFSIPKAYSSFSSNHFNFSLKLNEDFSSCTSTLQKSKIQRIASSDWCAFEYAYELLYKLKKKKKTFCEFKNI